MTPTARNYHSHTQPSTPRVLCGVKHDIRGMCGQAAAAASPGDVPVECGKRHARDFTSHKQATAAPACFGKPAAPQPACNRDFTTISGAALCTQSSLSKG